MKRRALLVGINHYPGSDFGDLECCEEDARAMAELLRRHGNHADGESGEDNFECTLLTATDRAIDAEAMAAAVDQMMSSEAAGDECLFYFSGHGWVTEDGGYLVTQGGTKAAPGYPMRRLLEAADNGEDRSVLIILDCCHSGQIGNITAGEESGKVLIGPEVTVLAAAAADQESAQYGQFSLFTHLLLQALEGGAADARGMVYAAAVFAYVEQALGEKEQCPVYKCYSRRLKLLRKCRPLVSDESLMRLPELFLYPEEELNLDPDWLHDDDRLARLQNLLHGAVVEAGDANEVRTVAEQSGRIRLTPMGRMHWERAIRGDFGGPTAQELT